MKATVDRDLCIGCGLCEQTCPEVFRIDEEGLAMVIDHDPPVETYADVRASVELCPVSAIEIAAG